MIPVVSAVDILGGDYMILFCRHNFFLQVDDISVVKIQ